MAETTRLRMLNRAKVNAMISSSEVNPYAWHYKANRSVLYEERNDVKDVMLSHIIAYYYLPTLNKKEREWLRKKIQCWDKNIEKADEDEMLKLLMRLRDKGKSVKHPKEMDKLLLNIPLGVEGKGGKFVLDRGIPNYLLGPAPVFAYALEQSKVAEVWFYEIMNYLEMQPSSIIQAYEIQEKTLKNFLGEYHYSVLFPYLLLLNRQGKYIFYRFHFLQSFGKFIIPPILVSERDGGKALLVSSEEVFASEEHRIWFLREFINENKLHEGYMALEDVVGVVELKRFAIVLHESWVDLAYMENGGYFLIKPDGLCRL
jgi:hypothetical protein